ncbi:vacuolar fusion protein CCZ1 homolog [Hetaerina americana]|uniref:vacuolar fusion protein CCZ1 homolog n=1 Tax=Hetaerina americana TaxID=62018 RepID=UPI003A7F25F5
MSSDAEIRLINFYVVNTSLGHNEGEDEEKKILFYYPSEVDLDTQMKNVGLSEAIIKFSETFNPGQPCEALHTQKTRQLYLNPEKGYWIVMTVSLPCVTRTPVNNQQSNDKVPTLVRGEEEVQDRVYLGILRHAYRTFRLFSGSFVSLVEKGQVKFLSKAAGDVDDHYYLLRNRLEHFFSSYLSQSLHLNHADLLEVFQGVSFLPLDRRSFLRVRCFLSRAEEEVDWVLQKYEKQSPSSTTPLASLFLYNDQLLWSGLNADETQVLYRFLVGSLLPAHLEGTELQGGSIPRHGSYPSSSSHYGRFVTGPSSLCDGAPIGKLPLIFLSPQIPKQSFSEGKSNFGSFNSERSGNKFKEEPFHLLVYRALSATLCLIISDSYSLTLQDFREIDAALGPGLTSLASQVAETIGGGLSASSPITPSSAHSSPASSSSPASVSPGFAPHLPPPTIHGSSGPHRFLYFNRLNLAFKSSIHLDNRGVGNVAVSRDILMMLADINADLRGYPGCYDDIGRSDNQDRNLQKRDHNTSKSVSAEIMMKTYNDAWVVGKLSDQREFYVVLSPKKGDLIAVNEEVRRLCENQFKCIFFHD